MKKIFSVGKGVHLFPLPFLLLGLAGDLLLKVRWGIIPFSAIFGLLIFFSWQALFLLKPPNNLLAQTKAVDNLVIELADNQPYNFALIAPGNSDHAYRYFLEIWGKTPVTILNPDLDPQRQTVTLQLIVVCEQKDCAPLGHPLWEIAGFGQGEIAQTVTGPAGIKVLKLVHYKG